MDLDALDDDRFTAEVERQVRVRAPRSHGSGAVAELIRALLASERLSESVAGSPRALLDEPDQVVAAARLAGEARRTVLQQPLLTATAVARLLGSTARNTRQVASGLRSRGDLLGVPRGRAYLYPAFQIDPDRQVLRESVATVNRLLHAREDPWGAASWWVSGNSLLDGQPPLVLAADPGQAERLIAAAASLRDPVG